MEEKKNFQKKEAKFIDNIAYKSKFQFLIWINDYVICQRYFKINGFNEESVHSAEFNDCMNGIVRSIQSDLESKSRVFMWYTNITEPLKMTGFLSEEEIETYGSDFFNTLANQKFEGAISAPDGKVFEKTQMYYDEKTCYDYSDGGRPEEGEFIFRFAFLIDDVPVFEKIWDGNVYPKFVRNGVDLANNYSLMDKKDTNTMSFGNFLNYSMQKGKNNLISEFIRKICETLSNSFTEEYVYTVNMDGYTNKNEIDRERYITAVSYYGGTIKPEVVGHTDIEAVDKKYNYRSAYENYRRSWRSATKKKTQDYFFTLFPTQGQLEYIDKRL